MEIRPHDGNTPRRKGKLRWKDPDDMEIGKQIKEQRESGEAGVCVRERERERERGRQAGRQADRQSLLNTKAFYLQSL